jgi:hypothetical protein
VEQPYFAEHSEPYWPQDHVDTEEAVQEPVPQVSEQVKSMPDSPATKPKVSPRPASVEVIECFLQRLEPWKPYWPQDHIEPDPAVQASSSRLPSNVVSPPNQPTVEAVERKPTTTCPAAMKAKEDPVQRLELQKPVHMKHQLPQRPKYSGQGNTVPPRLYHHGQPQVYQGRSGRPLVEYPGMPPYMSDQSGLATSADQYVFRIATSQHGYLAPAHLHYAFGQPYSHHAHLAPMIPHVDGSLGTPHAYHAPVLPAHLPRSFIAQKCL